MFQVAGKPADLFRKIAKEDIAAAGLHFLPLPREDRLLDKAYAVAMMFAIQPIVYLKSVSTSPLTEAFFSYAPLNREFIGAAASVAVVAAAIATVSIVGFELRKGNTSLPKLLYYTIMLAHPVILYLLPFQMGFFYMITYFWSHWFIATGLVGRINTGYQRSRGHGTAESLGRHVLAVGWIVALALTVHIAFGNFNVFSGKHYKQILAIVG